MPQDIAVPEAAVAVDRERRVPWGGIIPATRGALMTRCRWRTTSDNGTEPVYGRYWGQSGRGSDMAESTRLTRLGHWPMRVKVVL